VELVGSGELGRVPALPKRGHAVDVRVGIDGRLLHGPSLDCLDRGADQPAPAPGEVLFHRITRVEHRAPLQVDVLPGSPTGHPDNDLARLHALAPGDR